MEIWCYLRQSLQRGREGGGGQKAKGISGLPIMAVLLLHSNVSSADARVHNQEVLRLCAVSLNVPDLAVKLKWLQWLVGGVEEGT